MSTINTLAYTSPSFPQPAKPESAAKADRRESTSTASQPTQTDSYDKTNNDKTNGKVIIMPPKGAVRIGEKWVWPPEALAGMRVDKSGHRDKLLSKEEVTSSAKGTVAGNGGAGASDAEFKAALTREAVEYSDLEKNIHSLLGFTLETFKTTFEAEGKLSAWASLADGTFFSSAFSGYAASYSILNKYTFDDSFRAQYNTSPGLAVEYGFDSLRAMMESVVIRQSEDGNTNTSINK